MRSLLLVIPAFLTLFVVSGCGGHPSIPPGGAADIPFDLIIPSNTPVGDYHAISGLSVETVSTQIGDSIVEVSARSFYAQFYPSSGDTLAGVALLNGNPLARNRGGDTLRLESAIGGDIYKDNIWSIIATAGDTVTFPAILLDPIDSIAPFNANNFVRGDTSLRIAWGAPKVGSGGVLITWEGPTDVYTKYVEDFGAYTIPAGALSTLVGRGKVTLTRFRNDIRDYKGKTVVITRLAQRSYKVTVQP